MKLIIKRINEKYKDINWEILSEENVKIESNAIKAMIGYGFLILLMEQKILSKGLVIMLCI